MDTLSKSTILYVNQVRQESFDKLIGKGFSEAFSWRTNFHKIVFICYSSSGKPLYKKLYGNCFLIGIPFNLSLSPLKSFINIGKNYLKLFLKKSFMANLSVMVCSFLWLSLCTCWRKVLLTLKKRQLVKNFL